MGENKKNPGSMKKALLANMAALLIGIILTLALLVGIEAILRAKYNVAEKFSYNLNAELMSHVFLFNRSYLPSAMDPAPRVFCLGGSTTNGCSMPINLSYPNILQAIFQINEKSGTAYNFGVSGVNSVTTNSFIKNILPKYKPSCVVIHDGYNDLPVVVEKLADDRFLYIRPDYNKPYNPYIKNKLLRYAASLIKCNFFATRRFILILLSNKLHLTGDLFLGYDYQRYKRYEGTSEDIFAENDKRLKIMLEKEIDSIDYCLENGIKVIVVIEPYIKPMHFVAPYQSGFRDQEVGYILSECHKKQQTIYLLTLLRRYADIQDVVILDMRTIFEGKYDTLFYDECHLNGQGNYIKAQYVFSAIQRLFPDTR